MAKKTFADGSVLLTGQEMTDCLLAAINCRGNFDRECSFCRYENTDDERCDDCSIADMDRSCSCHINPPCGKCTESRFEESPYLINYKVGTRKWQCFKGDKETFDKLTEIEKTDFELSAEILSTGKAAMYIGDPIYDDIDCAESKMIEICQRKDFKETMCKMIMEFKVN